MSGFSPKIVLFADDLTGANDAGVQIAKRGIETITLLDPSLVAATRSDAIVIDTESRMLSADAAREALRVAAGLIPSQPDTLIYKKIDSTLRGPIGAELSGLIDVLSPDAVVCVPAYPKNGRTTRDGVHRVDGIPINETEFARDPLSPVDTAELATVLSRGGGPRFRHVLLNELRSERFRATAAENRWVSFDCEEQEDLLRIVALMSERRKRILWVGSAGLAEVLIEVSFPAGASTGPGSRPNFGVGRFSEMPTGSGEAGAPPVLAVAGSMSAVTRQQIERAVEAGQATLVSLAPETEGSSILAEQRRVVRELERSTSHSPHGPRHLVLAPKRTPPVSGPDAAWSKAISRSLAAVAADYLRRKEVAGLFLTGGDTAFEVARSVEAHAMQIDSELEPGVPVVRLVGGSLDGLVAVTKAGGFGRETTLLRSLEYLERRH